MIWILITAVLSTDGSLADTQSKINSASAIDTIQLPLAGSFTWANQLFYTNGQVLDFNNSTITHDATGKRLVMMKTHATSKRYLVNGKFSMSTADTALNITSTTGTFSNARFQVTNCYFTSSANSSIMVETETVWGLFWQCHFAAPNNSEHVHNIAWGAVNGANGWTDDVAPGTIDQVYFEDSTWTNNATFGNPAFFFGNSCIQGYYGARTVLRYCTMNMSQFDNHGGTIGGRWWEVYSNTWVCVANANQDRYCGFRSGSGVVYGNQKIGSANAGSGNIDMSLQATDSATYGPGKGKDSGSGPTSEPVYLWNNSANMTITSSQLSLNTGYFLSVKSGYSALAYPHPDLFNGSTNIIASFGPCSLGKMSTQ